MDSPRPSPGRIAADILRMTAAMAIVAGAVFFFLIPSHAAVSSIAGLAIVINRFLPWSVSAITFALNALLLVVGFLICGNEFGAKTVYSSMLLPAFLFVLERLFPDYESMTGDATLDVVAYIFTVSIGISILFGMNASSGGTDIIAMILHRTLRMDLGRAVAVTGLAISLTSVLAFDAKTVVLSVLGSYFNGVMVEYLLFSRDLKRRVCIVSPKEEQIRQFILYELGSGATVYEAIGAYHMKPHREIIVIVDKREFQRLMAYLEKTDPQAFVTVYKVSEMHFRSKRLEERIFSE